MVRTTDTLLPDNILTLVGLDHAKHSKRAEEYWVGSKNLKDRT